MRKRQLGKTGIEVSELALGTWGLSGDAYGPVPEAEADRTIDRAVALGITLFDTADVYAQGGMERKLGKRLPAQRTMVVTKLGTNLDGYPEKNFTSQYLYTAFERAQDRLKRDCVDIVLLHNPSLASLDNDEAFTLMKRLKSEARIRAWGVSAGSYEVAEKAIDKGCEVLEMAYNCFLFRDVKKLAVKLRTEGVGLLARSVLGYGLLAGHWTAEREFYPPDHRADRWNQDELRRRVEQIDAMRAALGGPVPTLRSVALRYVLQNERVSAAVLGPRNVTQLDQLVRDAGRMPPYLYPPTMAKLEAALLAHGVTGE
ncbi:MAG: aldo/keto reductase [Polyangiaceae bacterium]|nr:aldo/keto reductase [Polyangiaceae bacterium]